MLHSKKGIQFRDTRMNLATVYPVCPSPLHLQSRRQPQKPPKSNKARKQTPTQQINSNKTNIQSNKMSFCDTIVLAAPCTDTHAHTHKKNETIWVLCCLPRGPRRRSIKTTAARSTFEGSGFVCKIKLARQLGNIVYLPS